MRVTICLFLLSAVFARSDGAQIKLSLGRPLSLTAGDKELLMTQITSTSNTTNRTDFNSAASKVYDHFAATFDNASYAKTYSLMQSALKQRGAHRGQYRYMQAGPHCDPGQLGPKVLRPAIAHKKSSFPGGIASMLLGFSFGAFVLTLTSKATGPLGAGAGPETALLMIAVGVGTAMVQSMAGSLIHVVPPLIPPPAWDNQPLPCMPMLTGHNCFGAVLHLITMADFVIADVTDAMLDGHISSFPNLYATKVGKTSDDAYKACFGAYMSMMCSSIFPKCTSTRASADTVPAVGRVPMCFYLCINTLVMCPGFGMAEIMGPCSMISVPPVCTQSFFWQVWKAPPQYEDFSGAKGFPKDCPASPEIEDEEPSAAPSPIDRAAAAAAAPVKLPSVRVH